MIYKPYFNFASCPTYVLFLVQNLNPDPMLHLLVLLLSLFQSIAVLQSCLLWLRQLLNWLVLFLEYPSIVLCFLLQLK